MAGAGPAVLSDLAVHDDIAVSRLVQVPVSGVDLSRSLRAIWLSTRRPTGAAEDLLRLALPQARRTRRPPETETRRR